MAGEHAEDVHLCTAEEIVLSIPEVVDRLVKVYSKVSFLYKTFDFLRFYCKETDIDKFKNILTNNFGFSWL